MYGRHPLLGILFIAVGCVALLWALGDLIVRVLIGVIALVIINHGMKLWGFPPMQYWGTTFFLRRWF